MEFKKFLADTFSALRGPATPETPPRTMMPLTEPDQIGMRGLNKASEGYNKREPLPPGAQATMYNTRGGPIPDFSAGPLAPAPSSTVPNSMRTTAEPGSFEYFKALSPDYSKSTNPKFDIKADYDTANAYGRLYGQKFDSLVKSGWAQDAALKEAYNDSDVTKLRAAMPQRPELNLDSYMPKQSTGSVVGDRNVAIQTLAQKDPALYNQWGPRVTRGETTYQDMVNDMKASEAIASSKVGPKSASATVAAAEANPLRSAKDVSPGYRGVNFNVLGADEFGNDVNLTRGAMAELANKEVKDLVRQSKADLAQDKQTKAQISSDKAYYFNKGIPTDENGKPIGSPAQYRQAQIEYLRSQTEKNKQNPYQSGDPKYVVGQQLAQNALMNDQMRDLRIAAWRQAGGTDQQEYAQIIQDWKKQSLDLARLGLKFNVDMFNQDIIPGKDLPGFSLSGDD